MFGKYKYAPSQMSLCINFSPYDENHALSKKIYRTFVQSLLHVRLTKPLRNSIFLVKNTYKGSFLLPSTCSILQRSFKIAPERIVAPLVLNASHFLRHKSGSF
jgi:hypothetical protein